MAKIKINRKRLNVTKDQIEAMAKRAFKDKFIRKELKLLTKS